MGAIARLTTKPQLGSPSRPSAAQSRPAIAQPGNRGSRGGPKILGPMQVLVLSDNAAQGEDPVAGKGRAR